MRTSNHKSERGQALLLFALVFPVVLSILALVLDVGWGFYVSKKAQAASDAAALAAVADAAGRIGTSGTVACGDVNCQSASACPSSGNLQTGCLYGSANGFSSGGDGNQQTISIAAGTSVNAPNVPDVPVDYWVQVETKQILPRWFSTMFSTFGLTPTARSTAALRKVNMDFSIDLLNRSSDCFVSALGLGLVCGEDFLALGFNSVASEGPIHMSSSNASGLGLPNIAAATSVLAAQVQAPRTYIMGNGGIQAIGGLQWTSSPVNGFPDGDLFADPMAGKGQPPVPTNLPNHPVNGGVIAGSLFGSPTVLPPGNYYSAITLPLLGSVATGLPITITGNVIFSDGAATPCGGFCNYVFYGGLVTAALSNVTVSPGRYVIAGAQPVSGGPGIGLTVGANAKFQDLTPLVNGEAGQNTDAGEIFIFTDSNYPGLTLPADIRNAGLSFPQARAGVMAGINPVITLHGLNKSNTSLPAELAPFAPVLIWQDQANTTLKYQSNGKLDLSCGSPCANILSVPGSQEMVISASQNSGKPGTNFYGTIYGPRGSWLTLLGILPGDGVAGPLQIITGALQMTLFTELNLKVLPTPPTRLMASLIE
jgi:hypothetical protein